MDIYVQQYKEKQLTISFSYMGHNVNIYLVIYMNVYVRYESNLITFWAKSKICEKKSSFGGGHYVESRETSVNKCRRPHHSGWYVQQWKTINNQVFIYGQQCDKYIHFWLFGGPVWPLNNQNEPILCPSYLLTYIYIHITYGINPLQKLSHELNHSTPPPPRVSSTLVRG